MEEKKKIGNAKLLIVAFVLTVAIIFGTTYAWVRLTKNSNTVNKITAGSLELTLDDTTSDGITLVNEVPKSYKQGMETKEYTFTLTNKNSTSSYSLSLKDLEKYINDENEEVTITDENRINDSKIRYILLKNGEESSVNKSKILTDRTIDSGTIEKGQTISYSLRVWIDSKAETDIMGKIFNAQLNIEATQTSPQQAVAFKTGDYVKMTPTSTSYTITTAMTGYDTDQTINPSELNLWRVISINSDGTMDLVSEYVSSTNVYFQGKTGYQNFISSLNQIASQYTNSKYTTASRHMGYNGQTGTITDTSALDSTTAPWTSSTSSSTSMSDESKGGGDREYQKDFNLVKSVLGTAVANKVGTTEAAPYWLASRKYSYNSSTVWYFSGRGIGTGGGLGGSSLYVYRSGSLLTYRYSRAVRPIITLKSGLTPSGSGTSSSPYVLS